MPAFDDAKTYQMLRSGRTAGVFQFESPLATDVLRQMRCDRFDDLVASNALLRPGPLDTGMHKVYIRRKRGEEPVSYALPELEPILRQTQGVITYQEQVMRIAQTLAGISLAEADVLRKAVGKKDAELIRAELGKFTEKAIAKGHGRGVIEELAGQIETFGRYGFNKSHSVAYSVLSYQTAYLKANYPATSWPRFSPAASATPTRSSSTWRRRARWGWRCVTGRERERLQVHRHRRQPYPLRPRRRAQRWRGRSRVVLWARDATGSYTDFFDFVERVDLRACNKRVFEALIHAGALDTIGGHARSTLPRSTTRFRERRSSSRKPRPVRDHFSGSSAVTGECQAGTPPDAAAPAALERELTDSPPRRRSSDSTSPGTRWSRSRRSRAVRYAQGRGAGKLDAQQDRVAS